MTVVSQDLEQGRTAFERHSWEEAFVLLSSVDAAAPLDAEDLDVLGECAYFTGRTEVWVEVGHRSYVERLRAGAPRGAAMCACRLSVVLMLRGDAALGAGWLGRAQRLLAEEPECVEQGYALAVEAEAAYWSGDLEGSLTPASRAAEIGVRFSDVDLATLSLHQEGRARCRLDGVAEGMKLLDEAMIAVLAGDLGPFYTCWVYCSSISVCRLMSDVRRAAEWIGAYERWVDAHGDVLMFSGTCRLHRAEIMLLRGAWTEAEREARLASEQLNGFLAMDAAEAMYAVGELRRLVGDLHAAEEAFVQASRLGREPQAGLALLRMAQGRVHAAGAAIRRALAEPHRDRAARAALLPAQVEIAVAAGRAEEARSAVDELVASVPAYGPALRAAAEYSQGLVQLAEADPNGALASLRRAWQLWQQMDVPYEAARTRLQIGLACRALGDEDTAHLEIDAARYIFARLGATPDRQHAERLLGRAKRTKLPGGLTGREAEVLRLVAEGKSNRQIAAELFLSDKTVGRHLNNIFLKIAVTSRAAATAYAYEHQLV
ncbi:helix-turn-helix transcriptional regulator [Streptomyces sp. MBT97]|uniref:helix-turn-helix transcriptional regulator n=1 Tax=Streptomyces sp. MBT97 TaxID=2800411 RepID=UPI00190AB41E|nr:LuxR C-terminal-related transcriptional regulator [Streptomyces sp. MBT97]MBK3635565.1 helix-turn-helix transcriptional regulator [Streptomyces sp. MBT97]